MSAPVLRLMLHESGTAELLREGQTVWTSDSDPDVLEELGTDELLQEDIPDVLDYLVEQTYLTTEEADDLYDRDFPEATEDNEGDDDDDDDDVDEDPEGEEEQ